MNVAPIRRLIAVLGLVALLPIAFLLATGAIAPADAGLRAGLVMGAVALMHRASRWGVRRAVVARVRAAQAGEGQAEAT